MLRTRAFLITLICLLIVPSFASASTTLGPANPNPDPLHTQAFNFPSNSLLFTATAPAGVQLTAPFEGVITSWRLYTDETANESAVQLRTLTPIGPKTDVVTGGGKVEPFTQFSAPQAEEKHNVLHTFSSRLPIAVGEVVGVSFFKAATGSFVLPVIPVQEGQGWQYGCVGPACGEGGSDGTTISPELRIDHWLAMNATLEPDVDHDGLGDETQDDCVGVCLPKQTTVPTTLPAVTKKKCKKGRKLRKGKCVKKHRKTQRN